MTEGETVRRRGITGLVLVAAIVACAAGAQTAFATAKLKLQVEGETLPVGAPVVASSADFKIAGRGTVTCQNTTFGGPLEKNGTALSAWLGLSEATFGGEGEEGQCVSTYPSPLHHAAVELLSGLPARLVLQAKESEAVLKPLTKTTPGLEFTLVPLEEHPVGEAARCFYTKPSWPHAKYTHDGGALVVTFPPTKFRLYPNSGRDCGGIGAMISATFTFTSSGLPVDALIG